MEITCKNCHQGIVTGGFGCQRCGTSIPLQTVLGYERVNYLLTEIERPAWQAILPAEAKTGLLLPYRVEQRTEALRLGIIRLDDSERNRVWNRALAYLLKDITAAPAEAIPPEDKTRLIVHLEAERQLAAADYNAVGRPVPSLVGLTAPQRQAVLEQCLGIIARFELSEDTRQGLISRYRQQLAEVKNEIQQAATEAVQRQEAQKAAQRTEIRQALDVAVRQQQTPVEPPVVTVKPPRQRVEFKWEHVWSALLSETTLRALLYLGALFVVVAAGLFITLNWKQFPPLLQASMLLGVDLAFFAGSFATRKWLKLERAGLTFLAIGAAILPLAFYGYSRPELINLDNQGTWTMVSWLAAPCYGLIAWRVRERLFSYLASLAAVNALWAGLSQFGVTPGWVAVASVPVAAGLLLVDERLARRDNTRELSSAPFWVGQVTVAATALGLFSYVFYLGMQGQAGESLQWALGCHWWLTAGFYAWNARRSQRFVTLYLYGTAVALSLALFLTLQKLPFSEPWRGLTLGLVGLVYIAAQSLPELVVHLNRDGNAKPWRLREVLDQHKPFAVTGLGLVALGLARAYTNEPALAAYALVIAAALTLATLTYNWEGLAYGAVGLVALAVGLETQYLAVDAANWGWVLARFGLVSLALSEISRRNEDGRGSYFKWPLLVSSLAATGLMLLISFYNYSLMYKADRDHINGALLARDWLLAGALWAAAGTFYRLRWGYDAALLALSASLLVLTWPNSPLPLMTTALVIIGWGYIALEMAGERRLGLPLEQWGYGLAGLSLLISLGSDLNQFELVGGLALALTLATLWLTYREKLTWWRELHGVDPEISPVAWLWLAATLLPYWLTRVLALGGWENGLVITGLAVAYLGLALWLVPLRRKEGATGPGPFALPLLVGWLAVGGLGLALPGTKLEHIWLLSSILAISTLVAGFRLKQGLYQWLTVGLLSWATLWGFVWATLDLGVETPWLTLFLGILAIGLSVAGQLLNRQQGRAFRVVGHLAVFSAGASVTWFGVCSAVWSEYLPLNLVVLLSLTTLYGWIGTVRKAGWLFAMGFWASYSLLIAARWTYYNLGWDTTTVLVAGLVGLAFLAAPLYPWHRPAPTKGLTPHYALCFLAHSWAVLALFISLVQSRSARAQPLATTATQLGVAAALVVLYTLWSVRSKRAEWLIAAASLGGWLVAGSGRLFGLELTHSGLPLVGLAALYLGLAEVCRTRTGNGYEWQKAGEIMRWMAVGVLAIGLTATTVDQGELLAGMVVTTGLLVWLTVRFERVWGLGALASFLTAYALGFNRLGLDWHWFGLALFLPAIVLTLLAYGLERFAGPSYALLSQIVAQTALVLTVAGLPFSWQKDSVMLQHTLALTGLGIIGLRLTRRLEWLYGAIAASCYAAALTIYLLGVSWNDYGLALLPMALLYLGAMFYLTERADWLEDSRRLHGVIVLVTMAQGVVLAGLYFSWSSDRRLAINLAALTAFYLFDLAVTRWSLWLYAALTAVHLAALSACSALLTNSKGLVPTQAALLLLAGGLVMLVMALRLGRASGYTLNALLYKVRYDPDDQPAAWLSLKSVPFYLAALFDLTVSLGLSAGDNLTGLGVAATLTLTLLVVAVIEQNAALAWAGLGAGAIAAYFGYALSQSSSSGLGAIVLALTALVLTGLSYSLNGPRLQVLVKPFGRAAHGAALGALGIGLLGRTAQNQWENLSWIAGLLGLTYLTVSLVEQRRLAEGVESVRLRYLGYSGVAAIEGAFVLRLVVNSVAQPQLYVLPIGLACLIFAWIERSYLNRASAVVLEGLGLTLLLGTSLLQGSNFQTAGLDRHWYGIFLLVESLLAIGFGAANRLRYYFFGGIAALLLDLVILTTSSFQNGNLWLTIGITGLVLIVVAVFLERKRESVVSVSKDWLHRLKEWQ